MNVKCRSLLSKRIRCLVLAFILLPSAGRCSVHRLVHTQMFGFYKTKVGDL